MWVVHSKSQPTDDKPSLKWAWSRHLTHVKFLAPPPKVSLKRLKLETSNLVCMLIVAGSSLWTTNCAWKGRGHCHVSFNPGGNQEHISYSVFNDFALIVQFQHKGYLNSWLYFISVSFTTGHFCMFVIWKNTYYFQLDSWLSFQRLCRLLQGLVIAKTSNVMYRLNVQVTAYGRLTVTDRNVVRSCDPLKFWGSNYITVTTEPKVIKFCTHVGYINSSNRMNYLPQKGCGYGHVTVLKFCFWWCSASRGFFGNSWSTC